MADLATYQNQANTVYDPQQQNEAAQLAADKTAQIATLEGNKGTINQDYSVAVQNLNQSTQNNEGAINQLYTSRLGGNFSGLQGNDLGQMFARAHQDQTNIETTRANKLNDLAIQEGNVNNKYTVDNNALAGKYSALKNSYAYAGYADAVKQEQAQAYQNAQLRLAQERIDSSNYNAAASRAASANNPAVQKQADMATIANALQNKAGKDGHVSQQTWNAAMSQWIAAGYSAGDFTKQNMQFVNQRYGGYHGFD